VLHLSLTVLPPFEKKRPRFLIYKTENNTSNKICFPYICNSKQNTLGYRKNKKNAREKNNSECEHVSLTKYTLNASVFLNSFDITPLFQLSVIQSHTQKF